MYFLLKSHCVKRYRHFCQILALYTMPAYQIWSCHVTQDANVENFLFCPNSTFNIRKSGKALYFRSSQLKASRGVARKHPPPASAFRVNWLSHVFDDFICKLCTPGI